MQTLRCPSGEEILDGLTAMNRRAVPDHEQLAPHLAQELAEEGDNRWATEGLLLDVREESAFGGKGADHRQMVMGEGRVQHGCLAHRGVRAGNEGQQGEPRLIYEEDRAGLGAGFA